jgi:hypothetical protein
VDSLSRRGDVGGGELPKSLVRTGMMDCHVNVCEVVLELWGCNRRRLIGWVAAVLLGEWMLVLSSAIV